MTSEHYERERTFYMTQMREVRSTLADIGQRQNGLSEVADSVAAQNLAGQLQAERAEALRELNRISEDLRKLTLAEEARAAKEREIQQQNERAARERDEALARERSQQDELVRAEMVQREQARAETAARETDARQAEARQADAADRSRENNPLADAVAGGIEGSLRTPEALAAGVHAVVKAADTAFEVKQLAEHYLERKALESRQADDRKQLDQLLDQQKNALQQAAVAAGNTPQQIAALLAQEQQRADAERQRLEAQQAVDRERLAKEHADRERERNEASERFDLTR